MWVAELWHAKDRATGKPVLLASFGVRLDGGLDVGRFNPVVCEVLKTQEESHRVSRDALRLFVAPTADAGAAAREDGDAASGSAPQLMLERRSSRVLQVNGKKLPGLDKAGDVLPLADGDTVSFSSLHYLRARQRSLSLCLPSKLLDAERNLVMAAVRTLREVAQAVVRVDAVLKHDTTHYISPGATQTLSNKLLEALCLAIPVVTPNYVSAVCKAVRDGVPLPTDLTAFKPNTEVLRRRVRRTAATVGFSTANAGAGAGDSQASDGLAADDDGLEPAIDLSVHRARRGLMKGKRVVLLDNRARSLQAAIRFMGASETLDPQDDQPAQAENLRKVADSVIVVHGTNRPPPACWGGFAALDVHSITLSVLGGAAPLEPRTLPACVSAGGVARVEDHDARHVADSPSTAASRKPAPFSLRRHSDSAKKAAKRPRSPGDKSGQAEQHDARSNADGAGEIGGPLKRGKRSDSRRSDTDEGGSVSGKQATAPGRSATTDGDDNLSVVPHKEILTQDSALLLLQRSPSATTSTTNGTTCVHAAMAKTPVVATPAPIRVKRERGLRDSSAPVPGRLDTANAVSKTPVVATPARPAPPTVNLAKTPVVATPANAMAPGLNEVAPTPVVQTPAIPFMPRTKRKREPADSTVDELPLEHGALGPTPVVKTPAPSRPGHEDSERGADSALAPTPVQRSARQQPRHAPRVKREPPSDDAETVTTPKRPGVTPAESPPSSALPSAERTSVGARRRNDSTTATDNAPADEQRAQRELASRPSESDDDDVATATDNNGPNEALPLHNLNADELEDRVVPIECARSPLSSDQTKKLLERLTAEQTARRARSEQAIAVQGGNPRNRKRFRKNRVRCAVRPVPVFNQVYEFSSSAMQELREEDRAAVEEESRIKQTMAALDVKKPATKRRARAR